jgi:hypothetical protein
MDKKLTGVPFSNVGVKDTFFDDLPKLYKKKAKGIKGHRVLFDQYWEVLAKIFVPYKDNVWENGVAHSPGEQKNAHLYEGYPRRMALELANALFNLLTPAHQGWASLTTGDEELDQNAEVAAFLQGNTKKMMNALSLSNYYMQVVEAIHDLVIFGTGPLRMEKDPIDKVRFYAHPPYQGWIYENNRGIVDTYYREYMWTMRQIVQEWGDTEKERTELFKKDMTGELERLFMEKPEKKFRILHAIEPRQDLWGKSRAKGLSPFSSAHILCAKDIQLNDPNEGHDLFSYAMPRFYKLSDELYGRSPAMDNYPDGQTSNSMKKVVLQGGQLAIAPPLQGPDNGLLRKIRMSPWAVNYKRPGSDKFENLFKAGDPRIGVDILAMIKEDVKEGFFINYIRTIENDRMTATEIMQRRDEQFRTFGALLVRIDRELLGPVIDFTYSVLEDEGELLDPPDILKDRLKNGRLQVKYNSLIAKAQQQADSENLTRAIQASAPAIEVDPAAMDWLDADEVVKRNLRKFGVDEKFIKKKNKVDEIRSSRAQAQKDLQNNEDGESQAKQVKDAAPAMDKAQEQAIEAEELL